MKIVVDRDKCIGSGQCVMTDPAVFDQDEDDGLVILLQPEPPADHQAAARDAAMICPSQAITIQE
ncbi:ferredoxin [Fodinicola acaciae]|uniref:ferredoxin n=1 Tax=Fodinicola acaciae TaxID=2681555 RepID=UPI0013D48E20|nr:ferredoxin [Fodinicola acaciae]